MLRASATMTSCPNCVRIRLTHGEYIPVSQRNPAAQHSAKHFPHFVFNFAQFPVRCVAIVWGGGFMADSDAPRLRELTKEMASENDPARLKVLAEELKTILAKHRSMQPTESGAR